MREMRRHEMVNWIFLITVLFYIGASMTLSGWLARTDNLVLRLGLSQLILAIPTMGYLCLNGTSIRESIRLKKLKVTRILLLILLAELLLPLVVFVNSLSLLFTTDAATAGMQELREVPFFAGLLMSAVLPAVLEEAIYRGVFYHEYRQVSLWRGILLSSLLFALMHLNLNQFCYAFVMALIFAVVIEVTDSILSAMILHFWINASSALSIYLQQAAEQLYGSEVTEAVTEVAPLVEVSRLGAAAMVPTGLAVLVILWLAKLENRTYIWSELFPRRVDRMPGPKQRLFTLPLLAGILVCLGYIVMYEISLHGGQ